MRSKGNGRQEKGNRRKERRRNGKKEIKIIPEILEVSGQKVKITIEIG